MQKTFIQLTSTTPYSTLYTFGFLYTPISNTICIKDINQTYWVDEMFDMISEAGDIIRYIRVHKI